MEEFARTNHHTYLNYFSAMVDDKGFLKDELSNDGLHPNAQGYAVMVPLAEAAIEASLKRANSLHPVMPTTLGDIARALNVSKMTVSRAINNHPEINAANSRTRILAAARKMNYRPNQFARALTSKHSYLIGIVVPDLMHSYFAEICRGVESQARPAGYQNLICSTDEEARKELDEIEALWTRTDGLIVASALTANEAKFYRKVALTKAARSS